MAATDSSEPSLRMIAQIRAVSQRHAALVNELDDLTFPAFAMQDATDRLHALQAEQKQLEATCTLTDSRKGDRARWRSIRDGKLTKLVPRAKGDRSAPGIVSIESEISRVQSIRNDLDAAQERIDALEVKKTRSEQVTIQLDALYDALFVRSPTFIVQEDAARLEYKRTRDLAEVAAGERDRHETVFRSLDQARRAFLQGHTLGSNAIGAATHDFQPYRGLVNDDLKRLHLTEAKEACTRGALLYEHACDLSGRVALMPCAPITEGYVFTEAIARLPPPSATDNSTAVDPSMQPIRRVSVKAGLKSLVALPNRAEVERIQHGIRAAHTAWSFTTLQQHAQIAPLKSARAKAEEAEAAAKGAKTELDQLRRRIVRQVDEGSSLGGFEVSERSKMVEGRAEGDRGVAPPSYSAQLPPTYRGEW